jgi:hypothetical protein
MGKDEDTSREKIGLICLFRSVRVVVVAAELGGGKRNKKARD